MFKKEKVKTKNIGNSYLLNLVLKELKTLNTLGFILGTSSLLSQGIRDFSLLNSLFNSNEIWL
ncbi:hypothetical protein JDS99_29745 [Bacillus cereus group sp. N6]|uniref:hypothetical protein n=1 Tax=Bacillus cereus group sp. N6 TaxID=2794583 RepID=UPI0018F50BF1|nr:hypothetical protein [Bacillus cereus group sp. N6]MBJ8113710.1 hypothetical protein [Bacillus cereus group sp. N6]